MAQLGVGEHTNRSGWQLNIYKLSENIRKQKAQTRRRRTRSFMKMSIGIYTPHMWRSNCYAKVPLTIYFC